MPSEWARGTETPDFVRSNGSISDFGSKVLALVHLVTFALWFHQREGIRGPFFWLSDIAMAVNPGKR